MFSEFCSPRGGVLREGLLLTHIILTRQKPLPPLAGERLNPRFAEIFLVLQDSLEIANGIDAVLVDELVLPLLIRMWMHCSGWLMLRRRHGGDVCVDREKGCAMECWALRCGVREDCDSESAR